MYAGKKIRSRSLDPMILVYTECHSLDRMMMMQLLMSINWRGAVILSAVISIVFIAIPLIAIAFDFDPLQPVHAKGLDFKLSTYFITEQ